MFHRRKNVPLYFAQNLYRVIGIVLIWRGIWYVLDYFDKVFFNGGHAWTAFAGIALGLALLYLPDKDLKEIEKL